MRDSLCYFDRIYNGIKRYPGVLCIFFGALTATSLPPYYIIPVIALSIPGWLWLVERAPSRWSAWGYGWGFGFGYHLVAIHWVGQAFFVEADQFSSLAPFAIGGMAAGLACFPGFVAWGWLIWSKRCLIRHRPLLFALLWTGCAWLSGRWVTDFPWALLGSAWGVSDATLQWASLGGVWLLTGLAAWMSALPVIYQPAEFISHLRYRVWRSVAIRMVIAVAVIVGGGYMRLAMERPLDPEEPAVTLHLIQPNIAQKDKHQDRLRQTNFIGQVELTARSVRRGAHLGSVSLVIWPENAFFYAVNLVPQARHMLASVLPDNGLALVGGLHPTIEDGQIINVTNSIYAIDANGKGQHIYAKHHLVPFGEYIPYRQYLDKLFSLKKLTVGDRDFTPGSGLKTVSLETIPPFSPLICYEAIFPSQVVDRHHRPRWILNVTNDAWFGQSQGPWQHFVLSRLRAVEEGLPLIRAANTGISAVVDGYGRVQASLPLGVRGSLEARLPPPLMPTVYGRYGDGGIAVLAVLLMAWIVWGRYYQAIKQEDKKEER